LTKLDEILKSNNRKEVFKSRRAIMIQDKIDVTSFLTWLIGGYPDSVKLMKEDPSLQSKFK
jgi:hypothetical protein